MKNYSSYLWPQLFLVLTLLLTNHVNAQQLKKWGDMWIANSQVNCMVADTVNNRLYIGGRFKYIGPNNPYGAGIDIQTSQNINTYQHPNGPLLNAIPDSIGGWIISGQFTKVGDSLRGGIARLDSNGKTTSFFSNGYMNGTVYAMARSGSKLYIGGDFTVLGKRAPSCAILNTSTAQPHFYFPISNGRLTKVVPDGAGGWYVTGTFTRIGNVARNYIARVNADGTIHPWSPSPSTVPTQILVHNDRVYLSGAFTTVNGVTRNRLAAVDTINGDLLSWAPNASNAIINSMAVIGNNLYIGGYFTTIAGQSRTGLAAINCQTGLLTSFAPVLNGVHALATSNGILYVGGVFTSAAQGTGTVSRSKLAAFDTTGVLLSWNPNVTGPVSTTIVNTLLIDGSAVYIGGSFSGVGGQTRTGFASVNRITGALNSLTANVNGEIKTLTRSGNVVFMGGYMSTVGGFFRRSGASVDVSTGNVTNWDPVTDSTITDMAVSGSTIFIVGDFNATHVVRRNRLACFDLPTEQITPWNPDINGLVRTLDVFNQTIFVGGNFTLIGTTNRSLIGAIDSSGTVTSWNPAAAGSTNANVQKIYIYGQRVYVGGNFTSIGGSSRWGLASLDLQTGLATNWNPATPNTSLIIRAIYGLGNSIIVGGVFSVMGGQTRNNIASVDTINGTATSWAPQLNGEATGFYTAQGQLYVIGNFTTVSGQTRRHLAQFNSNGILTSWQPPIASQDLENYTSVAVQGNTIYLGGSFISVGGVLRNYLACINTNTGKATSWNPSATGEVLDLDLFRSHVLAVGHFDSLGGQYRYRIGLIDTATAGVSGFYVSANGTISKAIVNQMNGMAYLSGNFTTIGGQSRSNFAGVNLLTSTVASWTATPSQPFQTKLVLRNRLYVGGSHTLISGQPSGYLSALDTGTAALTSWNPSFNGVVRSMVVLGRKLFVSGSFTSVNNQQRTGFCAVDTASASLYAFDLPTTTGSIIYKMLAYEGSIFAGGLYYGIGTSKSSHLTLLDTTGLGSVSNWSPEPNAIVYTLARNNNRIFLGGTFTTIEGSPCFRLAAYDVQPSILSVSSLNRTSFCSSTPYVISVNALGSFFLNNSFSIQLSDSSGSFTTPVTIGSITASEVKHIPVFIPSVPSGNNYRIRVVATNPQVLSDTGMRVTILTKPQAAFTVNDSIQCLRSNQFIFNDTSRFTSGSYSRLWSFGQNDTSSLSTPSRSYINAGSQSVKLTVAGNNGCLDSVTKTVLINPNPQSRFSVNDSTQCLSSNLFIFSDSSTISTGSYTRMWYVGNQTDTSSAAVVQRTFSITSSLHIKLKTWSNQGCADSLVKQINIYPNPLARFTVADSSQCLSGNQFHFSDSSVITSGSFTRKWNFGGGVSDTNTLQNPVKQYSTQGTYTVKLNLTSNEGCVDSAAQQVTVYPQPRIGYKSDKTQFCLKSDEVVFTDTSSVTSGTLTRVWHLGDNTTDTVLQPAKRYMQSGLYQVKLISMSDKGCKDSITKAIEVYPQTVAMFSVNDSTQCLKGHQFMFTNQSVLSTGSFTSGWSFGDNTTSGVHHPVKQYASSGQYHVRLITTTGNGCKDTAVRTIQVYAHPTSTFSTDTAQCLSGNLFVMNNTSSGSPVSYHWNFGNGTTSVNTSPSVSYASAGNYNIQLVAQNSFGCHDTLVKNVRVKQSPAIPVFTYSPDTIVCDNISIVLKTGDTNTRSWMKDSSPLGVNGDSLVVTNNPGSYLLKVTNSENCDAASKPVNLFFKPTPVKPAVIITGQLLTSSSATGNQWYNSTGAIPGATAQTYTATTVGSYYTVVTQNGCSSIPSDVVSYPATGIVQPVLQNQIHVYPNPSSGSFTIRLPEKISGQVDIQVNDVTGKMVWTQTYVADNNLIQVHTHQLANGVYVVSVKTNMTRYNVSLIINR